MKNTVHFFVSPKNGFVWLMTLFLTASAISRVFLFHTVPNSGNIWLYLVLPVAATVLYILIVLLQGQEQFYKTAIPVWMLALFAAIWAKDTFRSYTTVSLFWIALFFFAFLYTDITSGLRIHRVWLLFPVMLSPLAAIYYYNRQAIFLKDWVCLLKLLPNTLLFLGCTVLVFAIRIHPSGEYHPTWGDRVDGRRLRSLSPTYQIIPFIMVNRNGSANLYEEQLEITNVERYIRQKRREGLTNFGLIHVFLACFCRGIAKYPGINRFISGQRVYSRGEDIVFSMTIKKDMSTDGEETEIKLHLTPRDTSYDVYRKMNEAVAKAKSTPADADVDKTAFLMTLLPGVLLKFLVWLLKTMDYFGLLPKMLLEISPFHGTMYFTSLGSLGIPPVYHHLYDFGNLPIFGAFGCKRKALEVAADGSVVERKYVDLRFTLDERIADGFYYAAFLKYYRRLFRHPEVLDEAPEEVVKDVD